MLLIPFLCKILDYVVGWGRRTKKSHTKKNKRVCHNPFAIIITRQKKFTLIIK